MQTERIDTSQLRRKSRKAGKQRKKPVGVCVLPTGAGAPGALRKHPAASSDPSHQAARPPKVSTWPASSPRPLPLFMVRLPSSFHVLSATEPSAWLLTFVPWPWFPDPVLTRLPHASPSLRLPRCFRSHLSLSVGRLSTWRVPEPARPLPCPHQNVPCHGCCPEPAAKTIRELSLLRRKPARSDDTLLCLLHFQ